MAAPSVLEGGALSLGEAESRPPLEMSSGVLTELFPVSGVLGGVVPFTSRPGDKGAFGSLDSGVPFVVGFESRIGETGGLGSGIGETGLGSGVLGSGVGLTAGFCSGVPTLAGVGSGVGETAGLASGVVAGFASGVGINAFGDSGVGLGIGLTSADVASGAGLNGFGSGVTGCLGSGDGLKVGFVSGGEMVTFGSGVAAGLGSGVGVTGGLGSGEGGGGAVDLATSAGFRSEVGAGFGGEGAVFSSEIWLGMALTSGAAEELNTSESAMAIVGASVSLSSGSPEVLKPTPESLVSMFLSCRLGSLVDTSKPLMLTSVLCDFSVMSSFCDRAGASSF